MDRETFERLKARAAGFARTSLTYLEYEHAAQYRVAADSDVLIALRGFNPEAGMDELHWAANGAGTLIAEIERSSAKTLVSFVPEAWKPLFDARGFAEYGVLREYWINELGEPARPLHACAPIGAEDCAAAAAVTAACRDQSREFHGDMPEWVALWLAGEDPDARAAGARDCAVLACREGNEIVGVACVALYGDGSPKGAVLWLRELAVTPARQGRGYGKALALCALGYGRERGGRRAFLMADERNGGAISLYRAAGFAPGADEPQIDMIYEPGARTSRRI